jgi:hypothetical protein
MERSLSNPLKILAEWETLERGSPEERACFAALGIQYGDIWLTRADDIFVNRLRDKVHLSAYRLAEWLAWNWWRLRWEPKANRQNWALAHHITTIGGGYVWPNITVFSDGERVVLSTKSTQARPHEPLRYIEDVAAVVRANAFENAVDQFIGQVRGQLRAEHVSNTNLDDVWDSVLAERADPIAASRRKFEALLGFDPDEADEPRIASLIADSETLGGEAMAEVAASRSGTADAPTARELNRSRRRADLTVRHAKWCVYSLRRSFHLMGMFLHGFAALPQQVSCETKNSLARLRFRTSGWRTWRLHWNHI